MSRRYRRRSAVMPIPRSNGCRQCLRSDEADLSKNDLGYANKPGLWGCVRSGSAPGSPDPRRGCVPPRAGAAQQVLVARADADCWSADTAEGDDWGNDPGDEARKLLHGNSPSTSATPIPCCTEGQGDPDVGISDIGRSSALFGKGALQQHSRKRVATVGDQGLTRQVGDGDASRLARTWSARRTQTTRCGRSPRCPASVAVCRSWRPRHRPPPRSSIMAIRRRHDIAHAHPRTRRTKGLQRARHDRERGRRRGRKTHQPVLPCFRVAGKTTKFVEIANRRSARETAARLRRRHEAFSGAQQLEAESIFRMQQDLAGARVARR